MQVYITKSYQLSEYNLSDKRGKKISISCEIFTKFQSFSEWFTGMLTYGLFPQKAENQMKMINGDLSIIAHYSI